MYNMLTFIIVNYRKPEMTLQCLDALYARTKNFKVVLVDNEPTPESLAVLNAQTLDKYENAKYVLFPKNDGYAPAANAGILAADQTSDIVWLNNDCFISCDAVDIIEKAFAESGAGIVGALLYYPNGKIQHDGMDYTPQVPGAFVHGAKVDPRPSRYCTSVTGALLAVTRATIDKIGLLDTRYFLACEDSDYCLSAWQAGFSVWFERNLVATHLEGATRGRTVAEKRAAMSAQKHARETNSIMQFREKFSNAAMSEIDAKAKNMNYEKGIVERPPVEAIANEGAKLDIGCGTNPTPGFIACDARKLRGVQHVFDFGHERWPFKDNTASEIMMQHSLEHVSFRRLPFVLGEARRVLMPGGLLTIRIPDLRFIIDRYLSGEITPEYPPDEDFIASNFGGNPRALTPGWWAVLKLFSGQDYQGNEHRFCFDFETLKSVLALQGFPNAVRRRDKPEWSPGEIYCEVTKP